MAASIDGRETVRLDNVPESKIDDGTLAEERVLRKLDWHMLPLFFVLCKSSLKDLDHGLALACEQWP